MSNTISFFSIFLVTMYARSSNGFPNQGLANSVTQRRRLNFASVNGKVVGVMLKAGGRRFYASSELCPGGVFLPKPVNENCLCFNGIFEIVRQCCSPDSTQVGTQELERKIDFKCGTSAGSTNATMPIRAILPLTKAYNRDSSVLTSRVFSGKNLSMWYKFDPEDIIVKHNSVITMPGKKTLEIVNVKPLGRVIKIWLGDSAEIAICYSGWYTKFPETLRIELHEAGPTRGNDCCFNINERNTPGIVVSDCAEGSVVTQLIDMHSVDMDIGVCDDAQDDSALHKIFKRQQVDDGSDEGKEDPSQYADTPSFSLLESSSDLTDILGDKGNIVFRKNPTYDFDLNLPTGVRRPRSHDAGSNSSSIIISLPRRKGLASAHPLYQQKAINEFVAIIRNDYTVEIREPKYSFRFQLLRKAYDIVLAVVPNDIIPHVLLKTAFDVFYFLYESIDSVNYDPPDMHKKAMGILDVCMNNFKPLNFATFGCPRQIDELVITPEIKKMLEEHYKHNPDQLEMKLDDLKHPEIKKDKRFIPERHDIYVEVSWKVVDFVHSFCFEHFKEEFSAHHFFEKELEAIFSHPDVQIRWLVALDDKMAYTRGIFPISNLELSMKQLDKVVAVGHQLSRYNGTFWLHRPEADELLIRLKNYRTSWKSVGISRDDMIMDQKERLMFGRNIVDRTLDPAEDKPRMGSLRAGDLHKNQLMGSGERDRLSPFQTLDPLPAGELIWDGRAVCLHASYSNMQNYLDDPKTWGLDPSLYDLGKLYDDSLP